MIVGLGNPGNKYDRTRHNAGFESVDLFADRFGIAVDRKKFGGLYGQGQIGDTKVIVLKPQEYMNVSGQVLATVVGFFRLSIENIIVVTDDVSLDPGVIRVRKQGSAGGHNGLKDIISRLGTYEFCRLRIGVGSPEFQDRASFVLSRPNAEDREAIDSGIKRSVEALDCWMIAGVEMAMNKFN
ncbi:MAG: aminoacyl-tRNA hydrolase [Planctomycetes bacterium]|nr:aminoacyl-tRNA hydrolase [Planctomycetota bacterium]